jgi:GNAT superfamily N-acetyltransferase
MSEAEEYGIRPLTPADQGFLWEMLYEALYVPEGGEPFAREVVEHPDIAKYVKGWGREGDLGFVAVDGAGRPVGAVWQRLLRGGERGFGYVDEWTPELGMAVVAEHRGRGVGTRLLARLVEAAGEEFAALSLSVSAGNPARRLYERFGFEEVGTDGDSVTMRKKLTAG